MQELATCLGKLNRILHEFSFGTKTFKTTRLFAASSIVLLVSPIVFGQSAFGQSVERPAPPTRDPHTPGYVTAKELPDGAIPPPDADGNFILGPTHTPAPEMTAAPDTPPGAVIEFTMSSADSKFYPGIAREPHTFGTPDPADPAKLIVTTSH